MGADIGFDGGYSSSAFIVPKAVSAFEEAVDFLKNNPDLLKEIIHKHRFVRNEEFEDELSFSDLTRARFNYGLELTFIKSNYTYCKRLGLEFLDIFK